MIECHFCSKPAEFYIELDGEEILLCSSDECCRHVGSDLFSSEIVSEIQ